MPKSRVRPLVVLIQNFNLLKICKRANQVREICCGRERERRELYVQIPVFTGLYRD